MNWLIAITNQWKLTPYVEPNHEIEMAENGANEMVDNLSGYQF